MRTIPLICFITVTLTLGAQKSPAHASNNYFLPGDAFFHSHLDRELALKLKQNPETPFNYRFVGQLAFCGYAGYSSLVLDQQNQNLANNIHKVYFDIRNNLPIELKMKRDIPASKLETTQWNVADFEETNGMSLFFYNADYDWQRRHIALKYNEDWLDDLKKFGFGGGRYCEFVKSPDAIIASWSLGKYIPPLNLKLPEVEIEKFQTVKTPLTPQAPLKALILLGSNYNDYFNMKNGWEVIEVTNEGISRYEIHHKEWKNYEELYGKE
tara:strand:- start:486 stop:1289 length:804 start_codon:yes stop_codon:yes gene_type:complete